MPNKEELSNDAENTETKTTLFKPMNDGEIDQLNRMLAAVMDYLSDETIEEIDIEYLLTNTEGLREWWEQYREKNRKQIEEEIKQSITELPIEELEKIRELIKNNEKV